MFAKDHRFSSSRVSVFQDRTVHIFTVTPHSRMTPFARDRVAQQSTGGSGKPVPLAPIPPVKQRHQAEKQHRKENRWLGQTGGTVSPQAQDAP